MSKIGRKPIELGSVQINIKDNEISFSGKKKSGIFKLAEGLQVEVIDQKLFLKPVNEKNREINTVWGLQRALLANQIKGAETGFEKQLRIVGLGYKAIVTGNKVQFSLGYSHKINYELPEGVTLETDKSGQLLTLRSSDKEMLGAEGGKIRALRPPEPYKGTGIQYVNEVIIRKSGKTAKSA